MKKKTFAKLAVLGLTNGLLLSTLSAAHNANKETQPNSLNHTKTLDKAKCGGPGGCGGTVASKCSGQGGCGSVVAGKCGSKCNAIADRDTSSRPQLESPVSEPSNSKAGKDQSKSDYSDPNSENMGYHLLTEDELLMQLNDQAAKQYQALSPEGKALAREVASQRCQGTNDCKGLNACQTDSNKCAGQGSCKGQSKCAFSDKNLVIKLVTKKMAEKRSGSLNK